MSTSSTRKSSRTSSSTAAFIDRLLKDTFSDDEEDLLLVLPRKPGTGAGSTKPKSKTSTSKGVEQYLKQLEEQVQEECNQLISNGCDQAKEADAATRTKQQLSTTIISDDHYIVYYHCPVCLTPGHQSSTKTGFTIAHIRQCAQKMGLHQREVISRVRSCPQRLRQAPKKTVSVSSLQSLKKVTRTKAKTKQPKLTFTRRECQLTPGDVVHQERHLSDRIAQLLHCDKLSEALDGPIDPSLPARWTVARLDSPSEAYYVPSFRKYFNFADTAACKNQAFAEDDDVMDED